MLKTGEQSWRHPSDVGNQNGYSNSRQQTGVKSAEGVNQDATVEICIINKKNKNCSNQNTVILSSEKTSTFIQPESRGKRI